MTNDELKARLTEIFPSASFEEGGEWTVINVPAEEWNSFAQLIRNDEVLKMDYLFCVTAVDWKTHMSMVYHLSSTDHRNTLVVKCKIDRETPEIDTVCDIWRTAEFHEREAYDLFGIIFKGHPDLRRLFLTDDWKGFPLRKDYEDPVNMIKL